jgi:hypothetical protein
MQEHLKTAVIAADGLHDARVYANRFEMVVHATGKKVRNILEIGVGYGDFSDHMIRGCKPESFTAVDIFRMHDEEMGLGEPTASRFNGRTHREYYENRLKRTVAELNIVEGRSDQTIKTLPDKKFDLIYIDALHDYESVRRDAADAIPKATDDAVMIFNDYAFFDPFELVYYGVVRAVNELVCSSNWKVIGFALQAHMLCDIALKRFD